MTISYKIQDCSVIEEYGKIPVSFMVESRYKVSFLGASGLGGIRLEEEKVDVPYCKSIDYDVPGGRPIDWPMYTDVSQWRFITAWDGDKMVGGLTVTDLSSDGAAAMLDERVSPEYRNPPGIGSPGIAHMLLSIGFDYLRDKNCTSVTASCHNTNIRSAKVMTRNGFTLVSISLAAPGLLPGEANFVFKKDLTDGGPAGT